MSLTALQTALHCFGTLRNSAGYFVPFSSRLLHTLTGWTPRTPASTSSSEWEQFQCFLNVFTDSWTHTHTQGEQKARPFGSQLLDYLWREYCTNHEEKKKKKKKTLLGISLMKLHQGPLGVHAGPESRGSHWLTSAHSFPLSYPVKSAMLRLRCSLLFGAHRGTWSTPGRGWAGKALTFAIAFLYLMAACSMRL